MAGELLGRVPEGSRGGQELLCLCHGTVCELERMRGAGEGGWMKVSGELEERSVQ